MKMKCIGIAGFLFVSAIGLRAQSFEISPFFGYRFGGTIENSRGESSDLKAAPAYGLSFDYSPYKNDSMKLELFWSRQDSQMDLGTVGGLEHMGLWVDVFQIGGVYESGQGRLHETVTALVGATVFSPEEGDVEARFSLSLGLGVKYFLSKNLALRADLRGYCTVVESEGAFISTGGNTVAYFSGSGFWQGEVSGGFTLSF